MASPPHSDGRSDQILETGFLRASSQPKATRERRDVKEEEKQKEKEKKIKESKGEKQLR